MILEQQMEFDLFADDMSEPTLAQPGSEEKVNVLAWRYANNVPLWNDADYVPVMPSGVFLLPADFDDPDDASDVPETFEEGEDE